MKIVLTLLIGMMAIGATLYSGLLHGRIRHEFGLGQDLTEQVGLITSLPSEFGQTEDGRPAWVMVGEPKPMADEVVEMLECAGHYQAAYRSTLHPEWLVQLLVMVGPSGPLLVHSPDVCYPASGNKFLSGPEFLKVQAASGKDQALQVMMFKQRKLEGRQVRVGFAFSEGGEWNGPSNARLEYAGAPFLYKLQLHTTLPGDYELTEDQDPLAEFMRHFQM